MGLVVVPLALELLVGLGRFGLSSKRGYVCGYDSHMLLVDRAWSRGGLGFFVYEGDRSRGWWLGR